MAATAALGSDPDLRYLEPLYDLLSHQITPAKQLVQVFQETRSIEATLREDYGIPLGQHREGGGTGKGQKARMSGTRPPVYHLTERRQLQVAPYSPFGNLSESSRTRGSAAGWHHGHETVGSYHGSGVLEHVREHRSQHPLAGRYEHSSNHTDSDNHSGMFCLYCQRDFRNGFLCTFLLGYTFCYFYSHFQIHNTITL